ncbi:hypothetical protein GCM10011282_30910 [Undibacterium macrobrachii]|jgi:hypothetical protein|uniref:DUF4304 domain-containing protein n=1 Tax=Undibacterium macrobrachii TaxID=1119058 RepID=A0ABQ2XLY3_9BURK|nr:hypothetical protein GCM10011282_30910 [Undibacterium macrobrachii]
MSSIANFNAVMSLLAKDLRTLGYKRSATWFTRRPLASPYFESLNVRKIPQAASKRIVLQVVAYAGQTPESNTSLVSSLESALQDSNFQRHILAGNAERYWTIWPSTDPVNVATEIIEEVRHQLLPALLANRPIVADSNT